MLQRFDLLLPLLLAALATTCAAATSRPRDAYADLVELFRDWREFERPPLRDGAPDYTAERMARAHAELAQLRSRLEAIDPSGWPVASQVDWYLVLAELNGFDFNCRVLQPWARDPAFYQSVWTHQSDVPAYEGPTHHALLELWTYAFPLSSDEQARLVGDLRVIPPLLAQARENLTGDARDLWMAGRPVSMPGPGAQSRIPRQEDRATPDCARLPGPGGSGCGGPLPPEPFPERPCPST